MFYYVNIACYQHATATFQGLLSKLDAKDLHTSLRGGVLQEEYEDVAHDL